MPGACLLAGYATDLEEPEPVIRLLHMLRHGPLAELLDVLGVHVRDCLERRVLGFRRRYRGSGANGFGKDEQKRELGAGRHGRSLEG